MGGNSDLELTEAAIGLGGMKHVRQCAPLVDWAQERVTEGLILDIGAHFGAFSIPLLKSCPELACHAFEPNPATADALAGMARMNGVADRVSVHQIALADWQGTATLRVPDSKKFSGLATLGKPHRFRGGSVIRARVQTLDGWARGREVPRIALIKIDVEGAELLVLKGGERTVTQNHPLLVLERQQRNTNQFGIHVKQVEDLVTSWGYQCQKKRRDLLCVWHS